MPDSRLLSRLFAPVDIASLVYFRVVFGAIMLWEVYRYFQKGWIATYWIKPPVNFPFYGFGWLEPLPGVGMYVLFAALGVLSLFIIVGFCYRVSIFLFFVGFTYSFLLEQARYLNHFYLIILISFLLIFLPAHRAFSIDARLNGKGSSDYVPAWTLGILKFQLGIVYFFGGIAKINADWLRGQPMAMWLADRTDFPLIGHYFREPLAGFIFSYGGLLFDLLIVPLLCWRRTRTFAFFGAFLFHLTNQQLFNIGVFPWMMMGATAIFFAPDWPRRVLGLLRIGDWKPSLHAPNLVPSVRAQRVIAIALVLYVSWQCLFPLRHLLYPGNTAWTEVGHRFSWRMKLSSKSGSGQFMVRNSETGEAWGVNPGKYLEPWHKSDLMTHPHMIWQFSRFIEEESRKAGHQEVEVYGWIQVSLNGRPFQAYIDPTVDLTAVPFLSHSNPWVLPLKTPFRP